MTGTNIKNRNARDLSSVILLPLWTMLNTLVLLANQATFLPWSSRAKTDSAKSAVLSSLQVELLELSAGHQVWWKILRSFMLTKKRWHAGRLCTRRSWCTYLIMLYMYIVSQCGYWKVMTRTIDTGPRCCGSRSFEDARYWCWWALDCLWHRQTFQVSGNTTFLLSLEHRKPRLYCKVNFFLFYLGNKACCCCCCRLFECCMTVQVATPFPSFLAKVQHGIPVGSCSVFPAVNDVLADLPPVPESIPDDYMPLIEKFVAVLYSCTSAT